MAELRALLEGLADPYDALDQLKATHEMIYDILDILREQGAAACVSFHEDH